MPSPKRKPRLQRKLMKLLAPETLLAPWRDGVELEETTVSVASHYEKDDAPMPRPWLVVPHPPPPDPPTVFAVVRVGEHAVVEDSEVYRSNTKAKAEAIAKALNALEEEAEKDQEPEDVSQ